MHSVEEILFELISLENQITSLLGKIFLLLSQICYLFICLENNMKGHQSIVH